MSTNHDLYLDLCAALAVGSIEPADRRELEAHLAGGCAECRALLQALSTPVEALARSVDPVKPSRGLKARTMVAVAQIARGDAAPGGSLAPDRVERPAPRRLPAWAWAVAALLLVIAGAGWWRAASLGERVDQLVADAPPDPDAEWEAFLAAKPRAKVIEVAANENGDRNRRARVAYDAASRTALAHFENFQAPSGKDFELWTIRDQKAVSEGLVRVDRNGRGLKRIENTGDPAALAAFAVSNEGAGGSKDRQTPGTVGYMGAVPK